MRPQCDVHVQCYNSHLRSSPLLCHLSLDFVTAEATKNHPDHCTKTLRMIFVDISQHCCFAGVFFETVMSLLEKVKCQWPFCFVALDIAPGDKETEAKPA